MAAASCERSADAGQGGGAGVALCWKTFVHTLPFVQYEWDPGKAAANLKKHGVSFADAVTVFEDEFALTREDADADDEQRFVTLGACSRRFIGDCLYIPLDRLHSADFGVESRQGPKETI